MTLRCQEITCHHCGARVGRLQSHYCAIPKVGTRGREWLIINQHGGLREEFTGTEMEASTRAAFLTKEARQAHDDNMRDLADAERRWPAAIR